MWGKTTFPSLDPVGAVRTLRRLEFGFAKVGDGRVQPLASLRLLDRFDCSTNMFTTEQLAWLRAHLPENAKGRVLAPIERLDHPLPNPNGHGPERDVLVFGKRKPYLNAAADAARIQRYIDDHQAHVEGFRSNPSLEPSNA
jgi:hypothetical protein